MGAVARNLVAGSSSVQCMVPLKAPEAWAHNGHCLVDGVFHHTGSDVISKLPGQSSPLYGIPLDNSKGQLEFRGSSLGLIMMLPTAGRRLTTSLSIGKSLTQHCTMRHSPGGIPRCQFCLSDSHSSHDCTFDPDTTRTGNHPPDVGQSGLIPLKSAACLISQGAASAALNSAGMHIYVPGATSHTQCRSATGTSSTIPGQPHLRARRGKQTGRLPLSSSYAKLIWGPSPIDPAAFLLI